MRNIFEIVEALNSNYGMNINTPNGSIWDKDLRIDVRRGITIEEILLIVEGLVKNGYKPKPLELEIINGKTIINDRKKEIKTTIDILIVIPLKDEIENRGIQK